MGTQVFANRFVVSSPPRDVLSHLAEPANYVGLNPFVYQIRDVRPVGRAMTYVAVERLTVLRVLTYDNPIRVRSWIDAENSRFVLHVAGRAGVTVTIVTAVAPLPVGTEVHDTITLTAPAVMSRYAGRLAVLGRDHRAATLRRRLA